tara:strand:+ start:813 stop:1556 length:744 start_codon:yes stop_codon:yes gene_type:complete
MNISFVIPCYNCEKIIQNSLKKLIKKLSKLKISKFEIIVIDDGSTDNTYKSLKLLKNKKIKIIKNISNLGKSSSLIKGIKKTLYKKIILSDSDLPYFEYLPKLIKLLNKNHLVYIDRKSPKSKLKTKKLNLYQICRYFIGRIVCLIINLTLLNKDTGDTQAGLKGFIKPKSFNNFNFISKKFFFDAELMTLFYRSNAKLASIPLKYKIYTNSTIKLIAFENFIYLYELLKMILFYRFNKVKKINFNY